MKFSQTKLTLDEISLQYAHPGTIQIDCSGAFITHPYDSNEASDSSDISDFDYDGDASNNINLPSHNAEIIHIALDIGGTLTKLVYFTKSSDTSSAVSSVSERTGGKLHFKYYQTSNFSKDVIKILIKLLSKSQHTTHILATGGGAVKFNALLNKTFPQINIITQDEMKCLITGLDFFITKIPQEIFTYNLSSHTTNFITMTNDENIYPYLLVNIGSGVSMIKVTGPNNNFERIGGSSLGGGTLWGLLSLLTDAGNYNEMLEMASRGNNDNIDLLVGDIYGTNYNKIGLKSSHIASSFAKVFKVLKKSTKKLSFDEKLKQFNSDDISRSLLYSISNNIGQIAYLQAQRFGLKRIYFGGSYISGHKETIHTLTYAVDFWSKGEMCAYFLKHEGYLGAAGAFLLGPGSVVEN